MRTLFTALLIICHIPLNAQTFLKADGRYITNENGESVILRGMGLGGWMLQEGYMLKTNGFAPTQHEIRQKISELIGPEQTEMFYDAWYSNHVHKIDIDSLKAWGFNAVRLPMHYNLFTLPIEKEPVKGKNTWLKKGFAMTDSLLSWCKDNEMYLILDLHAAPGGQGKNAAISDYDPSKPSLWESGANQQKTIALWKKLAERYADEPWIGGYDLINEPNWTFQGKSENGCDDTGNEPIWNLYKQITAAIREVDKNHIIFVEGNCWSQNISGFPGPWDNNMSLSFHKYWSPPTTESLEKFLAVRDEQNIPLWMGEAGENSNEWFKQAITLFEQHGIGWAWWPMKKIGNVVGPLTIVLTPEYQQLLDYWNGETPRRPSREFAINALMEIAEGLKLENCIYRPDVIDAMFRQRISDKTLPYKSLQVPGTIEAVNYDLGELNQAYYDVDYMRIGEGQQTRWNRGREYRNDGVDIEIGDDKNFYVGWTENGEWLKYTVDVKTAGYYTIELNVASEEQGKLSLAINEKAGKVEGIPNTNGKWQTINTNTVYFDQGPSTLVLKIENGGFYIRSLTFSIER